MVKGTISHPIPTSHRFKNLEGKQFGRLTVTSFAYINKKVTFWNCRCSCGIEKVMRATNLMEGHSSSCGCLSTELRGTFSITHGLANKHPLYFVWKLMKHRCYNRNDKLYHRYGGRGIIICDEWRTDFQAFYDWAIANGWQKGLEIDRINNDGNYEPSNCQCIIKLDNVRKRSNIQCNMIMARIIRRVKEMQPELIHKEISSMFNISKATVTFVLAGRTWR